MTGFDRACVDAMSAQFGNGGLAERVVGYDRKYLGIVTEGGEGDGDVGFGAGKGRAQVRRLQQEFAARRGEAKQYLAEANDAFGHPLSPVGVHSMVSMGHAHSAIRLSNARYYDNVPEFEAAGGLRMSDDIRALAHARWRVAIGLSAVVFVLYFGFILAVAFAKEAIAVQIIPGVSVGILAGAVVIVGAWITTWVYVAWANRHFDSSLKSINEKARG